MINKEITAFQEKMLTKVNEEIIMDKAIKEPYMVILGYDFSSQTFGETNIPIGIGMASEKAKQAFFGYALPKLFQLFDDNMKQILCICFVSEAWFRETTAEDFKNADKGKWRELPATEVLLINFETAQWSMNHAYPMIREGKTLTLGEPRIADTRKTGVELKGRVPEMFRKYNRIKFN